MLLFSPIAGLVVASLFPDVSQRLYRPVFDLLDQLAGRNACKIRRLPPELALGPLGDFLLRLLCDAHLDTPAASPLPRGLLEKLACLP
jgi:hypothetical protein